MAAITLVFPSGVTEYQDINGNTWTPNANGEVIVDGSVLQSFLTAGFTLLQDVASATRPTAGLYAGMPYFDTTLNSGTGLPIWRNASNSGWINASGATV